MANRLVIILFLLLTLPIFSQEIWTPFDDVSSNKSGIDNNRNTPLKSVLPDIENHNPSKSILIYFCSKDVYGEKYFKKLISLLKANEFKVTTLNPENGQVLQDSIINEYSQLWIISADYYGNSTLQYVDPDVISEYASNNGLVIWTDDSVRYQKDANIISNIFGVKFSGCLNNSRKEHIVFTNNFIKGSVCFVKDVSEAMFSESDGFLIGNKNLSPVFTVTNTLYGGDYFISAILKDNNKRVYFDSNILRIRDEFIDSNIENMKFIRNLAYWLENDDLLTTKDTSYDFSYELKEHQNVSKRFRRIVDFKPPEVTFEAFEILKDSVELKWECFDTDLQDTAFTVEVLNDGVNSTFKYANEVRNSKIYTPGYNSVRIILKSSDKFGNTSVDTLLIRREKSSGMQKSSKATQESCNILLYCNSDEVHNFTSLQEYLRGFGNSVDLFSPEDISGFTPELLEDYSQLWYFCTALSGDVTISSVERDAIIEFVNRGSGFVVVSDDSVSSQEDFNYIADTWDVNVRGNRDHSNAVSPAECIDDVHYFSHPIVAGIDELLVSISEGIISSSSPFVTPVSIVNERLNPDIWNNTQLTYEHSSRRIYFDSSIEKYKNDFFFDCASNPLLSKRISCWIEPYSCSCMESYASIGYLDAFQSSSCDSLGFINLCFQILDEDASISLETTTDGGLTWTTVGEDFFLHVSDTFLFSSSIEPGNYCLKWNLLEDFYSVSFDSLGFRLHIIDSPIPEFSYDFISFDITPPDIELYCLDSLFVNTMESFYWDIEEDNPSSEDIFIFLRYCGISEEHHVAGSFWGYTPDTVCESCTLIVEVRDLFCNIGRDTCVFQIFEEIEKGIDTLWMIEELYCDSMNIVEICYNLSGTVANIEFEIFDSLLDEGYSIGDGWFVSVFDTSGDIGNDILPGLHCFYWDYLYDVPENESSNWELNVHFGYRIDTFVIIDSLDISFREDFGQGLAYDGRFYWIYDAETGWVYKTTCMTCMPRDSFEIGTYHNSDIDYEDGFIYYGKDSSYCRHVWRKNVLFDYDEHILTIEYDTLDTHYPTVQGVHVLDDSLYVSWYGRNNMMLIRACLTDGFPITRWDTLFNMPVTPGDSCVRFEGLAESDEYLWGCNNQGRIIQIDLDIPSVIGCYPAPNIDVGAGGLCCDGDYIWYQNDLLRRIYKIQLKDSLFFDYALSTSLDNNSPRLELVCPSDSLIPSDTIEFSFIVEDMFYYTDTCTCYVEYCGNKDTIYTDDFDFSWISPDEYSLLRCDSVFFSFQVRDSFCNISESKCGIYIVPPCSVWIDSVRFIEETDCDDQNIVEICYNLKSTCSEPYTFVQARISSDNGSTWDLDFRRFSESYRDLYSNVLPGTHCWFWNLGLDNPGIEDTTFLLEIGLMDSTFSYFIQSDSAVGTLDSRSPDYSLYTNPQPAHPLESRTLHIRDYFDLFYPDEIVGSINLFACDSLIEYSILDSIHEFAIPYIHCPDAYFVVEIRDSFCNIQYDTLDIRISNLAPIILSCPFESIYSSVYDTVDVSLNIVDEIGMYDEDDFSLLEIVTSDGIDYFFSPGSLSIIPDETGDYNLTIIAYDLLGISDTCTFELHVNAECDQQLIKEGWNLLSAPINDTISADSLYPYSTPPLWHYITGEYMYEDLDSVTCGKGYWLLSPVDSVRTFHDYSLCSDFEIELLPGWNLIGVPDTLIAISDVLDYPEIIAPVYYFNFETFGYEATDTLKKFYGYWIFSTDTLYITIP